MLWLLLCLCPATSCHHPTAAAPAHTPQTHAPACKHSTIPRTSQNRGKALQTPSASCSHPVPSPLLFRTVTGSPLLMQPPVHLPHLQAPCPPGRSRHGRQSSASADTYSCSRATPALSRLPSGIFQPVLEENPLLAVPHSLWEGRGAWRRPPILLHEKKVTH